MDLEIRLAYCITVYFKCIIKKDVVIHLSHRKNTESNAFPCKFQKHLKRLSFGYQIFVDKHICGVVELHQNFRNPL